MERSDGPLNIPQYGAANAVKSTSPSSSRINARRIISEKCSFFRAADFLSFSFRASGIFAVMVFISYPSYYDGSPVVKGGEFSKGSAYALRDSGVTGRMICLRKGNSGVTSRIHRRSFETESECSGERLPRAARRVSGGESIYRMSW